MRFLLFIIFSAIIHISSFGQKIDYAVPPSFKNDISKNEYKKIVDVAVPLIADRYKIDFVKEGAIQLIKGQEVQVVNLDNIILKCIAEKDKNNWDKIVKAHLENMFSAIDEQKKIDPENYETIKKYLSIRIYPEATVNQRGGAASVVLRTDLEGTYTLLMLDLPGAFTPVQKKAFDLWKKDADEVFKIASANINAQEVEKVTKSFDFEKANIEISFLGNEDYAASYALDLQNNSPELVGEWGCAIVMPNKGLVDLCKISKDKPVDFVKFIQMTKPMTEQSYKEHPQPISDQYFWYYKGKFTKITVLTDAKGNINVISPAGLTELMTEKK